MLMPEEELAVEVAQVYGIEIDNVDFAIPDKNEILEELAPDASRTDHQNTRLGGTC